jgi:hypothetical protein
MPPLLRVQVVENCEERLSEEQVEGLLGLVQQHLAAEPAVDA